MQKTVPTQVGIGHVACQVVDAEGSPKSSWEAREEGKEAQASEPEPQGAVRVSEVEAEVQERDREDRSSERCLRSR